jgi:diguanylate cyclase (GGDEF)-like protein
VELGPLGFLTLRLVAPWYADNTRQHVIGYVELGMEIGGVLKSVQAFTGTPIVVLISKKHLQRKDWEAGMRMLGRTPNWDRFPDVVLSTQASDNVPASLAQWLESAPPRGPVEARLKAKCRAVFLPLTDVSGRDVGQMVLLIDVAPHIAKTHPAIYIGTIAGTCIVSLLTIFFYLLTGRIGRRIQRDEESLFMLATHDGLTGLYNHRSFYALLEEELARAQRFNRPVSLLMLDIDHFKEVNDTHGHQAGDAVLKGLSERLGRQARIIRVCRYGGEEIAVILPETDLETATNIAERIRASVEAAPFEIGTGEPVRITVSIGSATWPTQANSPSQLVAAADAAMYAAKQEGRNRINHSKTAVEEAS